jgi:hypothetical protein
MTYEGIEKAQMSVKDTLKTQRFDGMLTWMGSQSFEDSDALAKSSFVTIQQHVCTVITNVLIELSKGAIG